MPPTRFQFASSATANRLVAGVPAAARLARVWQEAQTNMKSAHPLALTLADGGSLDRRCEAEIARLAPGLRVTVTAPVHGAVGRSCNAGEALPDTARMKDLLLGDIAALRVDDPVRALASAHRQIVRATGKPGDGIVSRWLNRPLSQAATSQLLRLGWIRPGHATALTALIAVVMLACLLGLGEPGLLLGALLFQCASIADGIDGEMARATWRSSAAGAAWDSAIDALTNIAFIGGVAANLWQQGATVSAMAGIGGLAVLIAGTAMLGRFAHARGEPLNFDAAKKVLAQRDSAVRRWLRYITMRDFYCLFFAVMIMLGFAVQALFVFAGAAAAWLIAITVLLIRANVALPGHGSE